MDEMLGEGNWQKSSLNIRPFPTLTRLFNITVWTHISP